MNKYSILIPHWKTLKMTTYCISQFIKFKGDWDLEIIVIDNSFPDDSIKGLEPFRDKIKIINNTSDRLGSHGVAYDQAMEYVKTEWVITAESDSYPTQNNWLDYYDDLINKGYDCAGSLLKLSGGAYTHPAGALFKKSIWEEAKKYCDIIPYHYFPNMSMSEGFACHLMVHTSILNEFLAEPEDYIELSDGYRPYSAKVAEEKRLYYSSTVNPFHNGMGNRNESLHTYGLRTIESEAPTVFLDGKMKLIKRIGAEPGQWFSWYHAATEKKVFNIPSVTKWMPDRTGEQQEYTQMESGITHIWAGSSYLDMKGTAMHDVYEFKHNQIEQLYNTLPEYQKINL